MMLRPEIQVSHTFPDDAIEDDDDIVQWPGCNVAEAIKLALELRGYRVSDPIHMEFLGWELDIWRGPSTPDSVPGPVPRRAAGGAPGLLVGVAGFEPATPASRTRCSTRLSHTPT